MAIELTVLEAETAKTTAVEAGEEYLDSYSEADEATRTRILEEFIKVRSFVAPDAKTKVDGSWEKFELRVIGRLVDFNADYLWRLLWAGSSPRTLIGNVVEERMTADCSYLSRIGRKIFLTVKTLESWLALPDSSSRKGAAASKLQAKDAQIAALSNTIAALQTQLAAQAEAMAKLMEKLG